MKRKILEIMKEADIRLVGFCAFEKVAAHLLPCRAAERLPKNAKTVIMAAFPYRVRRENPQYLSRYAAVPDYHPIVTKRLEQASAALAKAFAGFSFVPFCDNSPVPEVYCAAVAGLGVQCDSGLLATPDFGTDVFLGEIVTDLPVETADFYRTCSHCGACKAACPMGVTCLSAISQKKGELFADEAEILQENGILWGCDICADACPLNRNCRISPLPEFAAGYRDTFSPTEDFTGRAYLWRGTQPILRNYENLMKKEE